MSTKIGFDVPPSALVPRRKAKAKQELTHAATEDALINIVIKETDFQTLMLYKGNAYYMWECVKKFGPAKEVRGFKDETETNVASVNNTFFKSCSGQVS